MRYENYSMESYKEMITTIKNLNSKLDAKIRKGNDEVIFYFNYTMM
jgi:hypothetical protein